MTNIVVQPEVIEALVDCVVDVIQNKIDWNSIDWQAVAEKAVKRPQGEWITHITYFECSNCKHCFEYDYAEDIDPVTDLNFKFCPNCGVEMKTRTDAD